MLFRSAFIKWLISLTGSGMDTKRGIESPCRCNRQTNRTLDRLSFAELHVYGTEVVVRNSANRVLIYDLDECFVHADQQASTEASTDKPIEHPPGFLDVFTGNKPHEDLALMRKISKTHPDHC